MSYVFVSRLEVKSDIIQAINYYKNSNPQLAKQFLFRIKEAKTYIEKSPVSFEVKYKEVRTLLLKQFPYHIHYLIDDIKNKLLYLLLFMHIKIQSITLIGKFTVEDK